MSESARSPLDGCIEPSELRLLLDRFSEVTGFATAILEVDGSVVAAAGWRDLCPTTHRTSDPSHFAFAGLIPTDPTGPPLVRRCACGLIDASAAVRSKDVHIGDVVVGQARSEERIPQTLAFLEGLVGVLARSAGNRKEIDAAERKRAEEALRESQELFTLFMRHSPILAFIKEVEPEESRIVQASDSFRGLIGRGGDEIRGKTMAELFPPEFATKIVADDQAVVARGEVLRLEEEFNGRSFTTIKFPILLDHRTLLAGYTIDVTDRVRAEEALRLSEAQLRANLEFTPNVGVQWYDEHGRVLYWNPASEAIYGWTSAEAVGRTLDELIQTPEEFTQFRRILDVIRTTGTPFGPFEAHVHRKDGREGWVIATTFAIPMGEGRTGFVCMDVDITLRKKAEEEGAHLQAQLLQAQKMESVGRLAGGVAHDFNNVLGVIMGNVDLALTLANESQPLHEYLVEIRQATERSADLNRQLLAFARKQNIAPKVLDLNTAVAGTLKMLHRLIGENVELVWRPAEGLWPVLMDPSQIDQVLANLCVNARDAIAGVGRVLIETSNSVLDEAYCAENPGLVPGEHVVLAVSDNGCGISEEVKPHIFEPFFTTKTLGAGTGLGLATTYGIVRQNDGFISVYSELGTGTTIRIYLPRHATQAEPAEPQGTATPASRGHETVLVVEDEPAILRIATRTLRQAGFAVLPASTPGEALRIAQEHGERIHLLVTDVIMPEMNGRDLADALRRSDPSLRCLFMSGYTADAIAHHGVLDEGVDFLQKPFSAHELADRVRAALDRDRS